MRPAQIKRLSLAFGVAAGISVVAIRRWMLVWGSTSEERSRPLPGDAFVPNPTHTTTHAVTIAAPVSRVWPWLVQMGQDRAGFYTHNWVERLLASGIPDVHELHAEWQTLRVGDLVRTNRERRQGHPLGWAVLRVEPNRAMVLGSKALPRGTYSYVLTELDETTTRLIVRDRAVWSWWHLPFRVLLFEPLHAYMETGVLRGIRARAEREVVPAPGHGPTA